MNRSFRAAAAAFAAVALALATGCASTAAPAGAAAPVAPAAAPAARASAGAGWEIRELAPGVELRVSKDASPGARDAADQLATDYRSSYLNAR